MLEVPANTTMQSDMAFRGKWGDKFKKKIVGSVLSPGKLLEKTGSETEKFAHRSYAEQDLSLLRAMQNWPRPIGQEPSEIQKKTMQILSDMYETIIAKQKAKKA